MNRATWLVGLALLLGSTACDDSHPERPLVNRCTQSFECAHGERCDPQLGFCTRTTVINPYPMVVLVVSDDDALSRTVSKTYTVDGPLFLDAITVPRVVNVTGQVLYSETLLDGGLGDLSLNAEVTFVPQVSGALAGGVSAFTSDSDLAMPVALVDGGVAATQFGYAAELEPSTAYDVRVYPIGEFSARLPPNSFQLTTSEPGAQNGFLHYPLLSRRSASILDENKKPPMRGSRVRLRDKQAQSYVSSSGTPDATTGSFQIWAPGDVLASLERYELVLDVPFGDAESMVSIVFDAKLFTEGAALTMPVVPTVVRYAFSVELPGANNVNADATFVSSFQLPTDPGDVRSRDWCRLKLPGSILGTFTCNTTVTASVAGTNGSAQLLPGDYDIYISPSGEAQDPARIATHAYKDQINSQSNGLQNAQVVGLERAAQYAGTAVAPQGEPMPLVNVAANALNIVQDLPELARYNRSTTQVSDGRGRFLLAVDTGFYDLLATPPEGSNYAWEFKYNHRIDDQADAGGIRDDFAVRPQIPLIARGTVFAQPPRTADAGVVAQALGQARIEAYALVDDLSRPGQQRAVRIARTMSDDHGAFALALPPNIGELPTAPADGGGIALSPLADIDAGVDIDAGD